MSSQALRGGIPAARARRKTATTGASATKNGHGAGVGSEPAPDGSYLLCLRNTGRSILPEQLPHLFERFSRFPEEAAEG